MTQEAVVQSLPNNQGVPQVRFDKGLFDSAIADHGYDILIEKAMRCPCEGKSSNSALISCLNCGGSGWIWINPIITKGILTSMNRTTRYREWSEEKLGTVSVTTRDIDPLSFYDRITVQDGKSVYSQLLYPQEYSGVLYSYCVYRVLGIEQMFLFRSDGEQLMPIDSELYSLEDNRIVFDNSLKRYGKDLTFSVRYKHRPEYYIIDLMRETMAVSIFDDSNKEKVTNMPVHGVARRAHNIMNPDSIKGNRLFDNSTQSLDCKDSDTRNVGC